MQDYNSKYGGAALDAQLDKVDFIDAKLTELESDSFDFSKKIVAITGIGKTAIEGNVRKVGEVFFNTNSGLLRKCVVYNNPIDCTFETAAFDESALYIDLSTNLVYNAINGALVKNIGQSMALSKKKIYRLRAISDSIPDYLLDVKNANTASMYDVVYKPTSKMIAIFYRLNNNGTNDIPPLHDVLYISDAGIIYKWNGNDLVSTSSMFDDCLNVYGFVGVDIANGYEAGVRRIGDIYFNSTVGKMRRCYRYEETSETSSLFQDIPNQEQYIYYNNGKFYKIENGQLVKTSFDKWESVREKINEILQDLNNKDVEIFDYRRKIIAITGIGQSVIDGNLRRTGEVFYNTQRKELRKCTNYVDQLSGSTYETVEFEDDALYLNYTNNILYKYNGETLVPSYNDTISFNRIKSFRLRAIADEIPNGALNVLTNPNPYKVLDVVYSPTNKYMYIVTSVLTATYNIIPVLYDAEYIDDNNVVYVWNGEYLLPTNEVQKGEVDDSIATQTFITAMRKKAEKIGMNITIEGVAGFPDLQSSDGKSTAKLYAIASGYEVLSKIWNQKEDITISSKGSVAKSHVLHSSVYGDNDGANHWASSLTDFYDMLGGKTGTWGNPAYNLLGAVIKGPKDCNLIGWVRRNPGESQSSNRWHSMKILMDIAFSLMENPLVDISLLETELVNSGVIAAQVLKLPTGNVLNYETFDFYKVDNRYENYNIYGHNNEELGPIASNTKVLTLITALDYISDLNELVTIKSSDLVGGGSSANPEFVVGEQFTIRELMYAMMMPSSNTAARALARHVGNILSKL